MLESAEYSISNIHFICPENYEMGFTLKYQFFAVTFSINLGNFVTISSFEIKNYHSKNKTMNKKKIIDFIFKLPI